MAAAIASESFGMLSLKRSRSSLVLSPATANMGSALALPCSRRGLAHSPASCATEEPHSEALCAASEALCAASEMTGAAAFFRPATVGMLT